MKRYWPLLLIVFCFRCNGQVPIKKSNYDSVFVIGNRTPIYINGHRRHELGMTYSTYPPYYQCAFCARECNPYNFLKSEPEVRAIYVKYNWGYGADSFFMAKWNEVDTSCISSEIAYNKSSDLWHNWLKAHPKGTYYIDKYRWMDTDGFVGSTGKDGSLAYAMGGRYNDSILLADKWYKIVYDSLKQKK